MLYGLTVTIATVDALWLKMADRGIAADGGMWNLPKSTISHDTKNLLQSTLYVSFF